MEISVIIPIYNEEESLTPLVKQVKEVLGSDLHEIVCIDDGSTDKTPLVLHDLQQNDPDIIRVITLRRNCGKALALQAGFERATGEIVVMMDADLQDPPSEIPKVIEPIKDGVWDAVSGWRQKRNHAFIYILFSSFFNKLIRFSTGLKLHDLNCGLKAFKKDCLDRVKLYGDMHRFLLLFIANQGYRIGEIPIENHMRKYGQSKYNYSKFYSGFVDLLAAIFIFRYIRSPLNLFVLFGLSLTLLGLGIGCFFGFMHVMYFINNNPAWHLSQHPLWVISPIVSAMGLTMMLMGFLSELFVYCFNQVGSFPDMVKSDSPAKKKKVHLRSVSNQ